jgi:hypothetical protein
MWLKAQVSADSRLLAEEVLGYLETRRRRSVENSWINRPGVCLVEAKVLVGLGRIWDGMCRFDSVQCWFDSQISLHSVEIQDLLPTQLYFQSQYELIFQKKPNFVRLSFGFRLSSFSAEKFRSLFVDCDDVVEFVNSDFDLKFSNLVSEGVESLHATSSLSWQKARRFAFQGLVIALVRLELLLGTREPPGSVDTFRTFRKAMGTLLRWAHFHFGEALVCGSSVLFDEIVSKLAYYRLGRLSEPESSEQRLRYDDVAEVVDASLEAGQLSRYEHAYLKIWMNEVGLVPVIEAALE